MGLTLTTITSYGVPLYENGQVYLSWVSSISGPSVWFQIYFGGVLANWTQSTSMWVPAPPVVENWIVGTVPAGEEQTSFAAGLPPAPNRCVELSWQGGTFESASLAGFYVYGEATAGGGINYSTPQATITAYPAGIILDGYGLGGYGEGGYGESDSDYSWTSAALTSGTWHFAVVPYDSLGNSGTPALVSQTIAVPPLAPPLDANGRRLEYTYNPLNFEVTLSWLASPG